MERTFESAAMEGSFFRLSMFYQPGVSRLLIANKIVWVRLPAEFDPHMRQHAPENRQRAQAAEEREG
jgi:hypothetical protein